MSRQALIVDDDEDIRSILSSQLSDLGFETTCASNGEKGLLVLNSGRIFDMIFLDINMPKISGLSLVKTLRQGNLPAKHTPICMVTGCSERDIIIRAANFGATEFLLKPWSESDLALKVKSASPGQVINFYDIKGLLTHLHAEEKSLFTHSEFSGFSDSTHRLFLVTVGDKRFCFVILKGIKIASIAALPKEEAAKWLTVFVKLSPKWVYCWPDSSINEAPNKNLSNRKVS